MFPFSHGKTIEVPASNNKIDGISEAIMNKLGDRILAEKPSSFTTNQYQIKFSGGVLRFVSNGNLLVSIDHGVITVVPANGKLSVSYKLWFTELLIVTSLTALAGVVIPSSGNSAQPLFLFAGIWSILFVPNFIITTVRFDELVRSVIEAYMTRNIAK